MFSSENEESERLLVESSPGYTGINGERTYVSYKRRWIILATVVVLNISNAMIWITFSPIADKTAKFYNINLNDVNWLSLVFPVAAIPFGLVASWMIDILGLRTGIIVSAWLNLIGCSLRIVSALPSVLPHYGFPLLVAGQCLAAVAQPFVLFTPTKLAAQWFPDTQRATANMVSSMANPLGILLANLITPSIVKDPSDIPFMMRIFIGPAVLGTVMAVFGVCSSLPPSPPTSSAETSTENTQTFMQGVKKLLQTRSYLILALCFGAGMGLFTSLTTLLEQILCPRGYSDSFAGLCGALLIGVGVIGAAVAGVFVDKTKKFEEVLKIGFSMASLGSIFFAIISRYESQSLLVGLSVAVFGFFGFALYPISLELGVECSFPVAEATSSGLLIISGQIQSIVLIIVLQLLAPSLSPSGLPIPSGQTKVCGGIIPQDYSVATLVFAGYSSLCAVILTAFFWCPYKRLQTEQQIAADRILNFRNEAPQNQQREIMS